MRIENYPYYRDIQRIMRNDEPETVFEYLAEIHTAKAMLKPVKLLSVDIVNDYVASLATEIEIEVILGLGDFVNEIFPNLLNLEVVLLRASTRSKPTPPDTIKPRVLKRYKAVILGDYPDPTRNTALRGSRADLNTRGMVNVRFVLIDKLVEAALLLESNGVFKNVKRDELLYTELTAKLGKITGDSGTALKYVDIIPSDNLAPINQIVLPVGMKTLDLPTYIQKRAGGLYNAGVGTYVAEYKGDLGLFVYPLHKPSGKRNVPVMSIYILPRERYLSVENSFKEHRLTLEVLCSGEAAGKKEVRVQADGIKMLDPDLDVVKPLEAGNNEVQADGSRMMYRAQTTERSDQGGKPMLVTPGSNLFEAATNVIYGQIERFDAIWEYSKPELIYPGMQATIHRMVNDKLVKSNGTLIFSHSVIVLPGKGLSGSSYHTTTYMVFSTLDLTGEKV